MRFYKYLYIAALFTLPAFSPAVADEGQADCLGVDFVVEHPVTIAKIIADKPHIFLREERLGRCVMPGRERCVSGEGLSGPRRSGARQNLFGQNIGQDVGQDRRRLYLRLIPVGGMIVKIRGPPVGFPPQHNAGDAGAGAGAFGLDRRLGVHAGGDIDRQERKRRPRSFTAKRSMPAAQDVHNGVIDATAKPAQRAPSICRGRQRAVRQGERSTLAASCACSGSKRCSLSKTIMRVAACIVTFTGFYRQKK